MEKYKLVPSVEYPTLFRVIALRDIPNKYAPVKEGEFGGFVESEKNLSQEGECWITENVVVARGAVVEGNALVEDSTIHENARISGRARISESTIKGDTIIEDAMVNSSDVSGSSYIKGDAHLDDCIVKDTKIEATEKFMILRSMLKNKSMLSGCGYIENLVMENSAIAASHIVLREGSKMEKSSLISTCQVELSKFYMRKSILDLKEFFISFAPVSIINSKITSIDEFLNISDGASIYFDEMTGILKGSIFENTELLSARRLNGDELDAICTKAIRLIRMRAKTKTNLVAKEFVESYNRLKQFDII